MNIKCKYCSARIMDFQSGHYCSFLEATIPFSGEENDKQSMAPCLPR